VAVSLEFWDCHARKTLALNDTIKINTHNKYKVTDVSETILHLYYDQYE
jgi:hypothetical protein